MVNETRISLLDQKKLATSPKHPLCFPEWRVFAAVKAAIRRMICGFQLPLRQILAMITANNTEIMHVDL